MAGPPEITNMALFCDFENIALGVRDAKYAQFDIRKVLERLLLKGSIVVKKAYCDWERYKEFKATMHEAAFELIEIPHVRQSGKNSADIRMVVDALDLCYTKSHVDTFEALIAERGEDEKVWGSMVKQTMKRRKPGFNESYYGYRSFGELLEDARKHKLLALERDEKSGQHIIRLAGTDE